VKLQIALLIAIFYKLDLPRLTQIKIALNTFTSEQLNEIRNKYELN